MSQGVYLIGELNLIIVEGIGKPTCPQLSSKGRRLQGRGVDWIRPGTGRSTRGQGETWRKLRGGLVGVLPYNAFP